MYINIVNNWQRILFTKYPTKERGSALNLHNDLNALDRKKNYSN